MIRKKIGLLLTVMSASVFAGGPVYPNLADLSGFYVGLDAGGDYNTQLDSPSSVYANAGSRHTPWGWSASTFMGYQFNSNWSMQFGYIWNQSQQLKKSPSSSNSTNVKFSWYNMYVAAKINVPLFDMFSAYALIGPAYTNANTYADAAVSSLSNITRGRKSIWTAVGALGVTYHWTEFWCLSAQYMFIMGDTRSITSVNAAVNLMNITSNTQRMTIAASYLFTM